ncbi:MAG: diguanylate cyclase [Alphaproteobacteria bacterium]|nr:diguanylate cyclase [Alphaproteobacteria bacterium]
MPLNEIIFDEDTLFSYIGYAAGLATILTFTIQILKIIETKKVTNLSSYMYIIYTLGLVCWAAYGIYIEDWILVVANFITFFFTFTILLLIIYYDAEDKIERERRDELTYVFNRKYFEQTVPVRLAEAKTLSQESAILAINSINYRSTHEKNGVKAGNKILKSLAKFLEKDLRENDLVARFEDDKFVIYLADANDKSAQIVANRLLKNAELIKVKISKKEEIETKIKIGICTTQHASTMEELLEKAEKAAKSISAKSADKIKLAD